MSKEFLGSVMNASRYVGLLNNVNLKDSKKIIFSFKKDADSYIYYSSVPAFGKINLGTTDCSDNFNYEVDFEKFMHLINSSKDDSIKIEFNGSQCKITSAESVVDILCWKIEDNDTFLSMFNDKDFKLFSKKIETEESLVNGLNMIHKLIGSSQNNAASLFKDKIMYADRSQIYQRPINLSSSDLPADGLVLHKNVFFVLIELFKINKNDHSLISFFRKITDNNSFLLSDSIATIVLSNASASIALPDDDDLKDIASKVESFTLNQADIVELLDFFSGFFVGNSWKPLTFINENKKLKIQYSVPSVTNVFREVGDLTADSTWTRFVIDASTLSNYVKNLNTDYVFLVEEDMKGINIRSAVDEIIFGKML